MCLRISGSAFHCVCSGSASDKSAESRGQQGVSTFLLFTTHAHTHRGEDRATGAVDCWSFIERWFTVCGVCLCVDLCVCSVITSLVLDPTRTYALSTDSLGRVILVSCGVCAFVNAVSV